MTPALQQLHWLPIDYRITYKLCLIMHLVHTERAPQYLSDSVQTVARSSSRPGLRSSNTAVYVKPRCKTKFGERGFSHAGPTAWNSLPHHLHHISDTGLFKRRLKTELFREHTSLVVSAPGPGRSVNSAIEMTVLLLLLLLLKSCTYPSMDYAMLSNWHRQACRLDRHRL